MCPEVTALNVVVTDRESLQFYIVDRTASVLARHFARPKRLRADRFWGAAATGFWLSPRKINVQALSFWLRLERL
jgi:hypothetical protein